MENKCECEYDQEGNFYECIECYYSEEKEKCSCIQDEIDIYCEWCY